MKFETFKNRLWNVTNMYKQQTPTRLLPKINDYLEINYIKLYLAEYRWYVYIDYLF